MLCADEKSPAWCDVWALGEVSLGGESTKVVNSSSTCGAPSSLRHGSGGFTWTITVPGHPHGVGTITTYPALAGRNCRHGEANILLQLVANKWGSGLKGWCL